MRRPRLFFYLGALMCLIAKISLRFSYLFLLRYRLLFKAVISNIHTKNNFVAIANICDTADNRALLL